MEEKLLTDMNPVERNTEMDFTEKAYDLEFAVRYGEIGENGVTTLAALGNWLQEATYA